LNIASCLLAASLVCLAPPGPSKPPECTDSRLVIELVAREPEIVTPTGLAVDERGRVWVIENHTHQRPIYYQGPPTDRVRIFEDFDEHGRPRRVHTFAEGFRNAMSLALGKDGAVFLATRSDIYVLRDRAGKGTADERRVIVKLDTPGNYPHNGLSGFAFDALDNLYFSLGENLGADYKLIGSDGTTLTGGGEGGSIYRCRPDGTGLVRVATGFWNTFHLTVDAFGRLFAVDNDPDARGPCRLLHIVEGGDYGFRFRNGRKGLHPFTAWNGELPGTLPMVAGTSEAPCGVVAYESTGLPADYRGDLLVTSWGDHLVERFRLRPEGASFKSQAQPLVRGGEDFRPVAIATAPDGSLYLSDWVDKSYPVHGKGRIWRIRMKQRPKEDGLRVSGIQASLGVEKLAALLHHPRQEIRRTAGAALVQIPEGIPVLSRAVQQEADPRARVEALWALVKREPAHASQWALLAKSDTLPLVRGEAVRLYGQFLPANPDKRDETLLVRTAKSDPSAFVRMQAIAAIRTQAALKEVIPFLADKDPYLVSAALEALGRAGNSGLLLASLNGADPRLRLGIQVALRRAGEAAGRAALPRFLADADPDVRRAAIQWVGEEGLRDYAPLLSKAAAQPPVTRELFEALLASNQFLAGTKRKPTDEPSGEAFIAPIVGDAAQPSAFRALALRMLRPDHPALRPELLRKFVEGNDPALQREALRTLALRRDEPSQEILRHLAGDPKASSERRAEAILGLAQSAATSSATRKLLLSLLSEPALRRDVLRSLRGLGDRPEVRDAVLQWWEKASNASPDAVTRQELAAQVLLQLRSSGSTPNPAIAAMAGPKPKTEADWRAALAKGGDAAAGERVFFHPQGPRCFACHRVDGRGAMIGPDLSTIGLAMSRDKLIESIVNPSKEIAPQFVTWQVVLRDGRVRTGMIVDEGPNSTVTLADNQGKLETIHRTLIEERRALPTSIMPENLPDLMTRREFLDLIAFLTERK
jgi:putative membrane-bound dehydrogenase-like protein